MAETLGGFEYQVGLRLADNVNAVANELAEKLSKVKANIDIDANFTALNDVVKSIERMSKEMRSAKEDVGALDDAIKKMASTLSSKDAFDASSVKLMIDSLSKLHTSMRSGLDTSKIEEYKENVNTMLSSARESFEKLKASINESQRYTGGGALNGIVKEIFTIESAIKDAERNVKSGSFFDTSSLEKQLGVMNRLNSEYGTLANALNVYKEKTTLDKPIYLSIIPRIDVDRMDRSVLESAFLGLDFKIGKMSATEGAIEEFAAQAGKAHVVLSDVSFGSFVTLEKTVTDLQTSLNAIMAKGGEAFYSNVGKGLPEGIADANVEIGKLAKAFKDALEGQVYDLSKLNPDSPIFGAFKNAIESLQFVLSHVTLAESVRGELQAALNGMQIVVGAVVGDTSRTIRNNAPFDDTELNSSIEKLKVLENQLIELQREKETASQTPSIVSDKDIANIEKMQTVLNRAKEGDAYYFNLDNNSKDIKTILDFVKAFKALEKEHDSLMEKFSVSPDHSFFTSLFASFPKEKLEQIKRQYDEFKNYIRLGEESRADFKREDLGMLLNGPKSDVGEYIRKMLLAIEEYKTEKAKLLEEKGIGTQSGIDDRIREQVNTIELLKTRIAELQEQREKSAQTSVEAAEKDKATISDVVSAIEKLQSVLSEKSFTSSFDPSVLTPFTAALNEIKEVMVQIQGAAAATAEAVAKTANPLDGLHRALTELYNISQSNPSVAFGELANINKFSDDIDRARKMLAEEENALFEKSFQNNGNLSKQEHDRLIEIGRIREQEMARIREEEAKFFANNGGSDMFVSRISEEIDALKRLKAAVAEAYESTKGKVNGNTPSDAWSGNFLLGHSSEGIDKAIRQLNSLKSDVVEAFASSEKNKSIDFSWLDTYKEKITEAARLTQMIQSVEGVRNASLGVVSSDDVSLAEKEKVTLTEVVSAINQVKEAIGGLDFSKVFSGDAVARFGEQIGGIVAKLEELKGVMGAPASSTAMFNPEQLQQFLGELVRINEQLGLIAENFARIGNGAGVMRGLAEMREAVSSMSNPANNSNDAENVAIKEALIKAEQTYTQAVEERKKAELELAEAEARLSSITERKLDAQQQLLNMTFKYDTVQARSERSIDRRLDELWLVGEFKKLGTKMNDDGLYYADSRVMDDILRNLSRRYERQLGVGEDLTKLKGLFNNPELFSGSFDTTFGQFQGHLKPNDEAIAAFNQEKKEVKALAEELESLHEKELAAYNDIQRRVRAAKEIETQARIQKRSVEIKANESSSQVPEKKTINDVVAAVEKLGATFGEIKPTTAFSPEQMEKFGQALMVVIERLGQVRDLLVQISGKEIKVPALDLIGVNLAANIRNLEELKGVMGATSAHSNNGIVASKEAEESEIARIKELTDLLALARSISHNYINPTSVDVSGISSLNSKTSTKDDLYRGVTDAISAVGDYKAALGGMSNVLERVSEQMVNIGTKDTFREQILGIQQQIEFLSQYESTLKSIQERYDRGVGMGMNALMGEMKKNLGAFDENTFDAKGTLSLYNSYLALAEERALNTSANAEATSKETAAIEQEKKTINDVVAAVEKLGATFGEIKPTTAFSPDQLEKFGQALMVVIERLGQVRDLLVQISGKEIKVPAVDLSGVNLTANIGNLEGLIGGLKESLAGFGAVALDTSSLNEALGTMRTSLEALVVVMGEVKTAVGKMFSDEGVFSATAKIDALISAVQNASEKFAQAGGQLTIVNGVSGVEQMTEALGRMATMAEKVDAALGKLNSDSGKGATRRAEQTASNATGTSATNNETAAVNASTEAEVANTAAKIQNAHAALALCGIVKQLTEFKEAEAAADTVTQRKRAALKAVNEEINELNKLQSGGKGGDMIAFALRDLENLKVELSRCGKSASELKAIFDTYSHIVGGPMDTFKAYDIEQMIKLYAALNVEKQRALNAGTTHNAGRQAMYEEMFGMKFSEQMATDKGFANNLEAQGTVYLQEYDELIAKVRNKTNELWSAIAAAQKNPDQNTTERTIVHSNWEEYLKQLEKYNGDLFAMLVMLGNSKAKIEELASMQTRATNIDKGLTTEKSLVDNMVVNEAKEAQKLADEHKRQQELILKEAKEYENTLRNADERLEKAWRSYESMFKKFSNPNPGTAGSFSVPVDTSEAMATLRKLRVEILDLMHLPNELRASAINTALNSGFLGQFMTDAGNQFSKANRAAINEARRQEKEARDASKKSDAEMEAQAMLKLQTAIDGVTIAYQKMSLAAEQSATKGEKTNQALRVLEDAKASLMSYSRGDGVSAAQFLAEVTALAGTSSKMQSYAGDLMRAQKAANDLLNVQEKLAGSVLGSGSALAYIDTAPFRDAIAQMEAALAPLKTAITDARSALTSIENPNIDIKSINDAYKIYDKIGKELVDKSFQLLHIRRENPGLASMGVFSNLEHELEVIKKTYSDSKTTFENVSVSAISQYVDILDKAYTITKSLKESLATVGVDTSAIDTWIGRIEKIKNTISGTEWQNKENFVARKITDSIIPTLESVFSRIEGISTSELSNLQGQLSAAVSNNTFVDELIKKIESLNGQLEQLDAEMIKLKASAVANGTTPDADAVNSLLEKRAAIVKELGQLTDTLANKQKEADKEAKEDKKNEQNKQKLSDTIKKMTDRLHELEAIEERRGKKGKETSHLHEQLELYRRILEYAKKIEASGDPKRIEEALERAGAINGRLRSRVAEAGRADAAASMAKSADEMWKSARNSQAGYQSQTLQTLQMVTSLDQQFSMLAMTIQNTFSIMALQQFAEKIIEIGGELEKQQFAMNSILGSEHKSAEIFQQVSDLSMISPFSVQDLVKNTKQLSAFGVQYENLYDTVKRLSDISAAVGVDFGRIAYEYGQMESMGYLDRRHLRMFSMSGVPLSNELRKYYSNQRGEDVSQHEIDKMIMKREISAETVKNILKDMTNEGGKFYNMQEIMAESLHSKWINLGNAINLMYGKLATSDVGDWLKGLAEVLTEMTYKWKELAIELGAGVTAFVLGKGVMSVYTSITQQAVTAVAAETLVTKELNAEQIKRIVTNNALTSAQMAQIAQTGKLTASQVAAMIATSKLTAAQGGLTLEKKREILVNMGLTQSQAAYVIGADGATAATVRLKMALVSTADAALANWPMLVIVWLGAMTAACYNSYKEMNKLEDTLEEISDNSYAKTTKEIGNLERLMRKLKSAKDDREKYADTINEIQSKYPEYFKNLSTEADKYDEVAAAADRAKVAIANKMKLQMQDDQIAAVFDIYKPKIKAQRDKMQTLVENELNRIGVNNISAEEITSSIVSMLTSKMSISDIEKAIRIETGNNNFDISRLSYAIKSSSRVDSDYVYGYNGLLQLQNLMSEQERNIESIENGYSSHPFTKTSDNIKKIYKDYIDGASDETERLRREREMYDAIRKVFTETGDIQIAAGENRVTFKGLGIAGNEVDAIMSQLAQLDKRILADWKNAAVDVLKGSSNSAELSPESFTDRKEYFKKLADERKKLMESIPQREKEEKSSNDPAQTKILEREKDTLERINKYGKQFNINWEDYEKSSNKSEKKDKTEEEKLRNRISLIKELYEEYKKWYELLGDKEQAKITAKGSAIMEDLLDNGADGNLDPEKLKENLLALRDAIDAANTVDDEKKKRLMIDINKAIEQVDQDNVKRAADNAMEVFKREIEKEARDWNLMKAIEESTGDLDLSKKIVFGNVEGVADTLKKRIEERIGKLVTGDTARMLSNQGDLMYESMLNNDSKDLLKYIDTSDLAGLGEDDRKNKMAERVDMLRELLENLSKEDTSEKEESNTHLKDLIQQIKENSLGTADLEWERERRKKEIDDRKGMTPEEKERYKKAIDSSYNLKILEKSRDYIRLFKAGLVVSLDEANKFSKEFKDALTEALNRGTISADEYASKIEELNEAMDSVKNKQSGFEAYMQGGLSGLTDLKKNRAKASLISATTDYKKAQEALDGYVGVADSQKRLQLDANANTAKANMDAAAGAEAAAGEFAGCVAMIDMIVHGIDNLVQGVKNTIDTIDSMNEALGKKVDKNDSGHTFMDAFSQASSSAASGWDSLKNGDIGGVINGVVGSWTKWVEVYAQHHDAYYEEEIQELKKIEGRITTFSSDLKNQFSSYNKNATITISNREQAFMLLAEQMESLGVTISDLDKTLQQSGSTGGSSAMSRLKKELGEYDLKTNQEEFDYGSAALNVLWRGFAGEAAGMLTGIGMLGGPTASIISLAYDLFDWNDRSGREAEKAIEYVKSYKEAINDLNKAGITEDSYSGASDLSKVYMSQYAALVEQRLELQKQIADENAKKDSDDAAIAEYQDQIAELNLQMQTFVADMAKELYDIDITSWADDISNALVDAFANGESAVMAFEDTINDLMVNVSKKILSQYIQEKYLAKLYDGLFGDEGLLQTADVLNDPQESAKKAVSYINEWASAEGESLAAFSDAYLEEMEARGVDLSKNSSGTSTSIKGMTEETADLLAAYMNGIRGDVYLERTAVEHIAYEQLPAIMEAIGAGEYSGPSLGGYRGAAEWEEDSSADYERLCAAAEMIALTEMPTLNATAESSLRQLEMQTEYLRMIQMSNASIAERVDRIDSDLHSVIYGNNTLNV